MKLQHLAERTATPVSTIKYYLREGLLAPGAKRNATTASYGREHVERLELIGALRQVVGLPVERVRQVVRAVEGQDPGRMMGTVQTIVLDLPEPRPAGVAAGPLADASSLETATDVPPSGPAAEDGDDGLDAGAHGRSGLRAREIIEAMGWRSGTEEATAALDRELEVMSQWGMGPMLDTALVYARAADSVAAFELDASRIRARAGKAGEAGDPDRSPAETDAADDSREDGGPEDGGWAASNDRLATYVAVGVHSYSRLLLRLLSVAQGSHARHAGG